MSKYQLVGFPPIMIKWEDSPLVVDETAGPILEGALGGLGLAGFRI